MWLIHSYTVSKVYTLTQITWYFYTAIFFRDVKRVQYPLWAIIEGSRLVFILYSNQALYEVHKISIRAHRSPTEFIKPPLSKYFTLSRLSPIEAESIDILFYQLSIFFRRWLYFILFLLNNDPSTNLSSVLTLFYLVVNMLWLLIWKNRINFLFFSFIKNLMNYTNICWVFEI